MFTALKTHPLKISYTHGIIALFYLIFVATVWRAISRGEIPDKMPLYLGLSLIMILLYSLTAFRSAPTFAVSVVYLLAQACLITYLVWLYPEYDFTSLLFICLAYQAATWYTSRTRWVAVLLIVAWIALPLMAFLGALRGLSLSLIYMATAIIIAGFTVAFQEIEKSRGESQAMLNQLEERHLRLEAYASQAEELAAIDERNRLARELHDSVSQTLFSIALNTRAAQILLTRQPDRAGTQLERLHELTQSALADMRSVIAQLRPAKEEINPAVHPPT